MYCSRFCIQDTIERIQERERVNIGGGETGNAGGGLTARQFSQLPTITFQPSIEDKNYVTISLSLLFLFPSLNLHTFSGFKTKMEYS